MMTRIDSGNPTQYGRAANGSVYRGMTIGSGYDCEAKRESQTTALVCLTHLASKAERMTRMDVEEDQDLQSLAIHTASNPAADSEWAEQETPEWDDLAAVWDAIKVI